jgi:hypothetical protein
MPEAGWLLKKRPAGYVVYFHDREEVSTETGVFWAAVLLVQGRNRRLRIAEEVFV